MTTSIGRGFLAVNKYRVVIVLGVIHAAKATEGIQHLKVISNLEQAMRFVDIGRADIVVIDRFDGHKMLNHLGISDIEAVGTLGTQDLFHYLSPQNKDLVPKIDKAIQAMKRSGMLTKLREKYEYREEHRK